MRKDAVRNLQYRYTQRDNTIYRDTQRKRERENFKCSSTSHLLTYFYDSWQDPLLFFWSETPKLNSYTKTNCLTYASDVFWCKIHMKKYPDMLWCRIYDSMKICSEITTLNRNISNHWNHSNFQLFPCFCSHNLLNPYLNHDLLK